MTTIAWDGTRLAADKRSTNSGLHRAVTKIRCIHGNFYAGAGSFSEINELMAWVEAGCNPDTFPAVQRDPTRYNPMMFVTPEKKVYLYEMTPYPIHIENKQYAIGSGRDYALAAMACGRDAIEAVHLAAMFDINTGNGVDHMEFGT